MQPNAMTGGWDCGCKDIDYFVGFLSCLVRAVGNVLHRTAGRIQDRATKGWQQAREATVDSFRKITGGPLAVRLPVSTCF